MNKEIDAAIYHADSGHPWRLLQDFSKASSLMIEQLKLIAMHSTDGDSRICATTAIKQAMEILDNSIQKMQTNDNP